MPDLRAVDWTWTKTEREKELFFQFCDLPEFPPHKEKQLWTGGRMENRRGRGLNLRFPDSKCPTTLEEVVVNDSYRL
jgi:hypothetical protein